MRQSSGSAKLGHGPHETIAESKDDTTEDEKLEKNNKGVKRDITIPTSKLHVIILPLLSKKSNDIVAHQVLDHSSQSVNRVKV